MAYQHLSGSTAGRASGTEQGIIACTPEFSSVISDNELSKYNYYSFTAENDHPVKFCHYYKDSIQCFIQSAVSPEYGNTDRDSSIAHTLALSEEESSIILDEHICPFSPAMFMNARPDRFRRPAGDHLPPVNYRFLDCRDREYNVASIGKLFKGDVFAKLVFALLLSAESSAPVFISLPGTPTEASLNAIRLMNILIPAFPTEYKKKMGFMTHVTDTRTSDNISIYFTDSIDLSRQQANGGFLFDLRKEKPLVSGIENASVKEYYELLNAVIANILSYEYPALNGFYDDIQPKLDERERFSLPKIKDIFCMWKILSGKGSDTAGSADICRIISSFYDISGIVDNRAAFLSRINGYWENEIRKCREGGYSPDIGVFDVIDRHYASFSDDDKRQAQRIWSFALIYSLAAGDNGLFDGVFTAEHADSALSGDIYSYVIYTYVGFITRRDSSKKTAAVYDRIISGYITMSENCGNYFRLFVALKNTVTAMDRFYAETGEDRRNEYDIFTSKFLPYLEKGINTIFSDAGLMRRFILIKELKDTIYGTGELGISVYQHFHSSFIRSVASDFSAAMVTKMADDRKALTEISSRIEMYPELGSVDMIALFQRYCTLINRPRDLLSLHELDKLVNKPGQQKAFTGWVDIYSRKYPELALSVLANTKCRIGDGASIDYDIDFMKAYKDHYDNIGNDDEAVMHDISRLITEVESNSARSEYRELGLGSFREQTVSFVNTYLLDRSADKRRAKENEARLKRFDKIKQLREQTDSKRKLFGKK